MVAWHRWLCTGGAWWCTVVYGGAGTRHGGCAWWWHMIREVVVQAVHGGEWWLLAGDAQHSPIVPQTRCRSCHQYTPEPYMTLNRACLTKHAAEEHHKLR